MVDEEDVQTRNIQRLGRLVLLGMLVQLVVIAYVFYSNYQGRQDLVSSQRRGCERGKLDRRANADGWRAAETARITTAAKRLDKTFAETEALIHRKPPPDEIPDLRAARRYDLIASGLEDRSRIVCKKQFPDAEIFA